MSHRALGPPKVAAAEIFGHRIGDNGQRSGWKWLNKKPRIADKITDYYLRPFKTYKLPGWIDEKQQTKFWQRQRRMKRGKMPVKKGEGKRAKKGKGKKKPLKVTATKD